MPTRVFIPLSSKKTPQGSNDNSRGGSRNVTPRSIYEAETPRTVAAALLEKQGLNRQQDHSSSAKAQKEYEENTLTVERVFSSRIATTKPSATRRAATDPRLAPLESMELVDHPENAARGARAAHKMARARETVKRAETRKHDLKKVRGVAWVMLERATKENISRYMGVCLHHLYPNPPPLPPPLSPSPFPSLYHSTDTADSSPSCTPQVGGFPREGGCKAQALRRTASRKTTRERLLCHACPVPSKFEGYTGKIVLCRTSEREAALPLGEPRCGNGGHEAGSSRYICHAESC